MPVRTRAYKPRMARDPAHLEHAEALTDLVPTQDLERHDERVCHEVVVHARMEDLNRAIVAARRKQWVRRVERE
jgi:hypothetical protein